METRESTIVAERDPMSDAGPVLDSPSGPNRAGPGPGVARPSVDSRPWRLRRPVLAGFVLYGVLVLVLATIGWFWLREREQGRQDGLLTRVYGVSGSFALDPDRSIRILEDEVLSQNPDDDTRRRALLVLAATYDKATRYDESDRTYETVRREWPPGLASGPLNVPWANMLVTAGKATRARELLAVPGATNGYGTPEEVDAVRARIAKAIESPPAMRDADVSK